MNFKADPPTGYDRPMRNVNAWCLAWVVTLGCFVATAADPAEVLVRGQGMEIRRSEVDTECARLRAEAATRGRILTDEQLTGLREQVLERIVLVKLCAARATAEDRKKAETASREFIEGLRRSQGDAGFARLLKQASYTEAEFRAAKLSESLATAVIDREVRAGIRIPAQDIREHYEKNRDQLQEPAAVRLLHLQLVPQTRNGQPPTVEELAAVRARIRDLKAQAERGADFATLVRQHSMDEAGKARGGEYRIIRDVWPPELEAEAFRVEPGKIGGPVETPQGLHLIRVLERIPPRTTPLTEVEESIRKLLTEREVQQRIPEFMDRIKREARLERTPR